VHHSVCLLRTVLLLLLLFMPQVLRRLLRLLRPAAGQSAEVSRRAIHSASPWIQITGTDARRISRRDNTNG
jgi:hypothetical protein